VRCATISESAAYKPTAASNSADTAKHISNTFSRRVEAVDSVISSSIVLTPKLQEGGLEEDDSQGYALFHDPGMHAVELRFPALAEKHFTILRDVLRNSSDAADRVSPH
jgi:hypothetical protein